MLGRVSAPKVTYNQIPWNLVYHSGIVGMSKFKYKGPYNGGDSWATAEVNCISFYSACRMYNPLSLTCPVR